MRKIYITLFLFLFLAGAALADMTGVEAPDFSLQDLDGNPVSLSRLSNTVVMLVHFNTYCHSCRQDVAKINSIVRKYKNLRVIGVAIANDAEEVAEFKKNFKPDYELVPDPQKQLYTKYAVRTVPLIDIIDRTGTIRYRGGVPGDAELAPIIEQALKEKETAVGAALWNKPPDFTLRNSEGETFHLYDNIGSKTIALGFFSVRHEGVHKAIEILKTVYSRYKRDDLDIIRIAVGDSIEEVKAFRKKYYVNFPVYLDEKGEVAKQYGVARPPKMFIINKKGTIRYVNDQISFDNLMAVLGKVRSYYMEELPPELLMSYIKKAAPEVKNFNRIVTGDNQTVYIGTDVKNEKILVREVFKDVFCDVCTNVHFVYSFTDKGKIKNILLIESIDLYGVPIAAEDFLQRVIQQADQKLPLKLKKDVDALTGATQSCKLLLEGLNETPQVLNALRANQAAMASLTK
jgi:peroxiredoxin